MEVTSKVIRFIYSNTVLISNVDRAIVIIYPIFKFHFKKPQKIHCQLIEASETSIS